MVWHNRNRHGGTGTLPRTPFSDSEAICVRGAVDALYLRTLYWTHTTKYEFPEDLHRTIFPREVWDKLAAAQALITDGYYTYGCSALVPLDEPAKLDLTFSDKHLVPDPEKVPFAMPDHIVAYANKALEHRRLWLRVRQAADQTLKVPRVAAAYYWPCLAALLKMGRHPDDKLAMVTSYHGNSPKLASLDKPLLRDTAGLVSAALLLPEIPKPEGVWASPPYTLGFESTPGALPDDLWPLGK